MTTDRPAASAAQATRVLVVSDDIPMAAKLTCVLRDAGHTVTTVTSPEYALEACATQSFDLAIVDEAVCQMAAPELARALRDFFSVATLFLSAYEDPEITSIAIEDGSLGFIVKPLDATTILPALNVALARAREMQVNKSRSPLRRHVDTYWQQLLTMGNKLFGSTDDSRDIDAAIARSRSIREMSSASVQHEQIDCAPSTDCESRRRNPKH
jgi:DNA-binding NtrC family response regulator